MSDPTPQNQFLPDQLPAEPFSLFTEWFDAAWQLRLQPNANAMVLATVDSQGHPAARVVLCKHVVAAPGYIVFFTNYRSHKGQQLELNPRAAAVFHWDKLQRQVRMTGPVIKSPPNESDTYFSVRPLASRIGAWASQQSEPLASRAQLAAQVAAMQTRFGITSEMNEGTVPRPPHWGGFQLWPETVELWIEGPGRVHDRAIWSRQLNRIDDVSFNTTAWTATRLNP